MGVYFSMGVYFFFGAEPWAFILAWAFNLAWALILGNTVFGTRSNSGFDNVARSETDENRSLDVHLLMQKK